MDKVKSQSSSSPLKKQELAKSIGPGLPKKGRDRPVVVRQKELGEGLDMLQIKNIISTESDDRYRFLLMHGLLKKTIKEGNVIFTELPQIPDVWVCYRRPQERKENLEKMELNGLELGHLPLLEGEERLKMLTFQHNRISKIENLISLNALVYLDLYDNQIKEIQNLNTVTTLKVLHLSKNLISRVKNLQDLTRLEVLDLHANRIARIEGLQYLPYLKILNLANNLIPRIEGLDFQSNLVELALDDNQIQVLENVRQLHRLEKLGLANNRIESVRNINVELANCPIKALAIENNPFWAEPSQPPFLCKYIPGLKVTEVEAAEVEDEQIRKIKEQWRLEYHRLQSHDKGRWSVKQSLVTLSHAELEDETYILIYGNTYEKVLENKMFYEGVDRIRFECVCFDFITEPGIIQLLKRFRKLRTLEFKHNYLHSLLQVSKLEALPGLRSVVIDPADNPLARCSYLRSFIIYRISELVQLNYEDIREADRIKAKSIFHNFDKTLQIPETMNSPEYMRHFPGEPALSAPDRQFIKARDKLIKEQAEKAVEDCIDSAVEQLRLKADFGKAFDEVITGIIGSVLAA